MSWYRRENDQVRHRSFLVCHTFFWYLCVVFLSEELRPEEWSEAVSSPNTLQGAVLFVVGAWTRHDRDPESD